MTHTERRQEIEEWDVEVCDACGHDVDHHYDEPKDIGGWRWLGCTILVPADDSNGRSIWSSDGSERNPYLRCPCGHSV